jgi:DNA-binding CsgD family transcriptional regulator
VIADKFFALRALKVGLGGRLKTPVVLRATKLTSVRVRPDKGNLMSERAKRVGDSQLSESIEHIPPPEGECGYRLDVRTQPIDRAGADIVRQLNGPLTALLIYIGEIKEHSHQFKEAGENRAYLQQVVENALQQTERVCALVKQIANPGDDPAMMPRHATGPGIVASRTKDGVRAAAMFTSNSEQKPLTRREREVLKLISDGHSNKQGALRMGISPRTFESHRAEAMRKLGARNTADLVRRALLLRDTA